MAHGPWSRVLWPLPVPPHRHPRMHNVLPNSKAYSYHLARAARKNGAVIRTGFRAKSLIVTENRITGVVANNGSNDIEFVAQLGVILAAGDYGSSKELKRAYLGDDIADIEGPRPSSTGDGHRMATKLGAVVVNSDLALGPEVRFVAPPRLLISLLPPVRAVAEIMKLGTRFAPAALIRRVMMQFLTTNLAPRAAFCNEGGILVRTDGRAIVRSGDKLAEAIPKQPDGKAFFVLDSRLGRKFSEWPNFISTAPGIAYAYLDDYKNNRKDIFFKPTPSRNSLRISVFPPSILLKLSAITMMQSPNKVAVILPPTRSQNRRSWHWGQQRVGL